MGFFVLFLYYYCGRSYLEICNVGLYSAYHSRYGVGLQRKILVWWITDGHICSFANCIEPRADELLFFVCDVVYGSGFRGICLSEERTTPFF